MIDFRHKIIFLGAAKDDLGLEKSSSHTNCTHSHGSHHHHHHGSISFDATPAALKRIRWAFLLNLSFAVIQGVGGLYIGSWAILSGALHDFGDSLALGLAYGLEKYSLKGASARYTYGYRRFSALSALLTGLILAVGSLLIIFQTLWSILQKTPEVPEAKGMLALAVLGLAVNGFAALKISRGQSLNEKMLLWHLLEDVVGWALVLGGSIALYFFESPWIDPALGLILSLWVLWNVSRNLLETLGVFLQAVPPHLQIDWSALLKQISGVRDAHHVHIWSLDGEAHILTGHIVLEKSFNLSELESVKVRIKEIIQSKGIFESTLEFEGPNENCADPKHTDKIAGE